MTTTTTDTYTDYLRAEGYVPQTDQQGNVIFKREGLTYILFASPDDSNYLRLVCPNIWKVDGDIDRIHTTLSAVNANVKAVKAFVIGDQVSASAEAFLETPESYKTMIPRLLPVLAFAVQAFANQMRQPVAQ